MEISVWEVSYFVLFENCIFKLCPLKKAGINDNPLAMSVYQGFIGGILDSRSRAGNTYRIMLIYLEPEGRKFQEEWAKASKQTKNRRLTKGRL